MSTSVAINETPAILFKVNRSRIEFVRYLADNDIGNYNLSLYEARKCKREDLNPRSAYLCDRLKDFVKEPYECLEADIHLFDQQYNELFTDSNTHRLFYVWIRFHCRESVNKMKLMYPKLMAEINIQ